MSRWSGLYGRLHSIGSESSVGIEQQQVSRGSITERCRVKLDSKSSSQARSTAADDWGLDLTRDYGRVESSSKIGFVCLPSHAQSAVGPGRMISRRLGNLDYSIVGGVGDIDIPHGI